MLRAEAVTIRNVTAAEILLERLRDAETRPVDLVNALGVSRPLASMMLAGKRGIPTWHLDKIAEMLEVPVSELFTSRDLIGQRGDPASDLSQEGRPDVPASAAPLGVQQFDPVLVETLEDVGRRIADAIARAKDSRHVVRAVDVGTRKRQPKTRRRAGGHR